ncbi:glutaminyl-peptide cyclotransferase [Aerosticca soli]
MDRMNLRLGLVLLSLLAAAGAHAALPVYGYRVVRELPHDTQAYTEGLFYLDGRFYESTGTVGASDIREVDPATGRVLRRRALPPPDYGEGIAAWKNRLYELTWQSGHGYIYDLKTFAPLGSFTYPGEGWALTCDGSRLYMSDGSADIRVLDPVTLDETARIHVTAEGAPVERLNELEWVKGELYANVWLTSRIARIDPASGKVTAWIDLGGLGPKPGETADPANDVLNGIAYDAEHDRLFVTGKRWPTIYQIELTGPSLQR